uniref:ERVV2 protein n=1 Tax=Gallus gallus TaxID=9031 RepID=A0A8V0X7N8_CHICK
EQSEEAQAGVLAFRGRHGSRHKGDRSRGCGPTAPTPWVQPTLTDWAQVREDLRAVNPLGIALTLPVVVKTEGPAWVPLDSKAMAQRLNLSDCWVCAALPRGGMMEFPLLGVPIPFRNWSWPWNMVQIQRMGRGESLYWSVQDSCDPGRHTSRLPSEEILCWSFQDPLPSRPPKVMKPDIACHLNTSSPRFETLSPWPNDTIILARNGSHSVGLWWLCGDGRARKSVPSDWSGSCTLGALIPNVVWHNRSTPPPGILRTHWRRVRRVLNPLVEKTTGFHSFARWFIPPLGVSELEKAIVNISATLEIIENATVDAIRTLQGEVSTLSKVVLQNRMALDLLTAKEGGVCVVINQSCCAYVDETQRVETDIHAIWERTRLVHQVSMDDTSFRFRDWMILWQLFIVCVVIIAVVILMCITLRCMLQCLQGTFQRMMDQRWEFHRIREKL